MKHFDNDDPLIIRPFPLLGSEHQHVFNATWPSQLFWTTLYLVIFLLVAPKGFGQVHHHPPEDAEMHERFYSTWYVPNNGNPRTSSCCSKKDCYRTQVKKIGSTWFALRREDGHWVPLPENKLEHNQPDARQSPDGQTHVCMSPPQNGMNVFCAVLGSQG